MDENMGCPSGDEAPIYDVGARVLPFDVERSIRRGERSEVLMSGSLSRCNSRDNVTRDKPRGDLN
jgi:hypothetical protein